jgi:hypothetical protein
MSNSSVEPRPARRHPSLLFLPLALPFVILAAVAVYGVVGSSSNGPPSPGTPGSLVWGNGIFANRVELRAWFALHGGNYAAWAKQHPAALRLVPVTSRQTRPSQKPTHAVAAATHTARPASHAVQRASHTAEQPSQAARQEAPQRVAAARTVGVSTAPASSRSWRSGANLVLWLLVVLGVLLGAAAAAPERLVQRLPGAAFWKERELRIGSAAAGVALLVGVAIATQLS